MFRDESRLLVRNGKKLRNLSSTMYDTARGKDFIALLTTKFFDVYSSPTVSRLGLRCPTRPEDFLDVG